MIRDTIVKQLDDCQRRYARDFTELTLVLGERARLRTEGTPDADPAVVRLQSRTRQLVRSGYAHRARYLRLLADLIDFDLRSDWNGVKVPDHLPESPL